MSRLLHELLERQAQERPTATSLIYRGEKMSYAAVQNKVTAWASVLHQRGVRAGDTFGIVMRNAPEFFFTFFALARLGARAVPVNFLLKPDEIAYIFKDAGVVGAIVQPSFLGAVLQSRSQLPNLKDVFVTGDPREGALSFNDLLANAPDIPDLANARDPEEPVMIIYTSGTTGKPKGAMLSHRNFVANVRQCAAMVRLSRKDSFLCLLPMFHSFAWTVCVVLPLFLGSSTIIVESIQPFGNVIKQILRYRIKIFVGVPPIFAALLRVPFWRPLRFINPLRLCISGAAALPQAVHNAFEKKFGIPLMEGYGLTEASPVVCLNPEDRRVAGSIGKALPGIALRFVDDAGQDVGAHEVGEICVRGENVMMGYFHDPKATQEAFLDKERLWLRSGDLGHQDQDGYVFISDRKKDLIIVKGLNVYPKEVEDVLLSHPAVQDAAVIGIQDETGDELIRAYVTLKEGSVVEKQDLMKICRTQLAPYKCPRDLEIRKDLPKNTLGKILKRTLRSEAVAK